MKTIKENHETIAKALRSKLHSFRVQHALIIEEKNRRLNIAIVCVTVSAGINVILGVIMFLLKNML